MSKPKHKKKSAAQTAVPKEVLISKEPEQTNPTPKFSDNLFVWLLTGAYVLVAFIGSLHHESWRDEVDPWLMGYMSGSLKEYFHNRAYFFEPIIWPFILYCLGHWNNLYLIQLFHLLVASANVFLVVKYAPFSRLEKILFCFGYFILFEYAIISKGHAMTLFFLTLFLVLYQKKFPKKYIWLGIVLFFLANAVGLHGIFYCLSLSGFMLIDYQFGITKTKKNPSERKELFIGLLIVGAGLWFIKMFMMDTPPDTEKSGWFFSVDKDRILTILQWVWRGFVPIIDFNSPHFWNTNFFLSRTVTPIIGAAIILFTAITFSKKLSVALYYLATLGGMLLFSYVSNHIYTIAGVRYTGFLYTTFISGYWLHRISPECKIQTPFLNSLRNKINAEKFLKPFLVSVLSIQFVAGTMIYYKDYSALFTNIHRTGKYLLEHHLEHLPATGFIDYTISPLICYTKHPVYFPDRDTLSPFVIWSNKRHAIASNIVVPRMMNYISQQKDSVLAMFDFDLGTERIGDYRFIKQADFQGAVVPDENYWIYVAKKSNLLAEIKDPNAFNEPNAISYFLSSANNSIQQGKLDEAETVLKAVLQKNSSAPHLHNYFGMLYVKKNNLIDAKKEFQKEIDLNLQKDEAYFQLGMLFYQQQKSDSAIFAWEKTVEFNPNNVDAYSNLGVCYLNFKHDSNKAEELWNKTVQLNPDYVQGYLNLMILCQNKKDENCLLNNLKIVLKKGVSPADIRSRGINITDDQIKKASS